MKTFKENDSVIYADHCGRQIDTFVVFETDKVTGLTHINRENLKVYADRLQLRPYSIAGHNLPLKDAFSLEILRKLKNKYEEDGKVSILRQADLAKAS